MNRTSKHAIVTAFAGLMALAALGSQSAVAAGTTRSVTSAGVDTGDCTSSPCATISYAIGKAGSGDTITVGAGNYRDGLVITKSLSLQASNAVIDATGKDNGVMIKGASAAGSTLTGFTIQNANQEGILVMETSGVTIANNTVTNNDLGANAKTLVGECAPQGNIPGDCGEAIHLWAVHGSTVNGNTLSKNMGGILLSDETGPTYSNQVTNNTIASTIADCAITLASHVLNIGSTIDPQKGGVYLNTVSANTVTAAGPEGAGVGMYAAAPGAAAYRNTVSGNIISGTTMAGIAIHSHAPFQNVNDNFIFANVLSKNGIDDDAGTPGPAGIVVFADVGAGASPIKSETISQNTISNNAVGIYQKGVLTAFGSNNTNTATAPSTVILATAPVGGPAGGPPAAGSAGAPPAGIPGGVPAAAGGVGISPPNTGDGGLVSTGTNSSSVLGMAAPLAILVATGLGLGVLGRHS